MRILYATAEVAPFSKVGGLADVAASLPAALDALGHETLVITPAHSKTPRGGRPTRTTLPFMGRDEQVTYRVLLDQGVCLVENATYFGRNSVYGFPDDLLRFNFFSLPVLHARIALNWRPDVIHCNDWQTAWLPLGLRNSAWSDRRYWDIASTLSIHNLGYRGPDPLNDILGPGIYYADAVNTVSPTYAREITTPEYGGGLDEMLRFREDRLFGILNGLDPELFDPATDRHLIATFDDGTIEKRALNKAALQQRMGLDQEPCRPIIGMVSRLDQQKGFDLVLAVLNTIVRDQGFQVAILGSGNPDYQSALQAAVTRHPGAVGAEFGFRADLASLIYGGVDLFLMPSRFEPCGLGQLIAMRYGAVPVVRRTGGLADTVIPVTPDLSYGTGFAFDRYDAEAMIGALWAAREAYREGPPRPPGAWQTLVQRAMDQRFTWESAARGYEEMYQHALRRYNHG